MLPGRTRRELLEEFTRERAEAAHVLAEWTAVHDLHVPPPDTAACDAEIQDAGSDSPPATPTLDIKEVLGRHIAALKEGQDASMASLVTIVLGLKGTVDKLSAQNEELLARLKRIEAKASPLSPPPQATATRLSTITATAAQATQTQTPTPAAPPAADKSKCKRSEPGAKADKTRTGGLEACRAERRTGLSAANARHARCNSPEAPNPPPR